MPVDGNFDAYGYDHAGAGPSAWRGDLTDGMIYHGGAWHKIIDTLVWSGGAWRAMHLPANVTATTSAGTDTSFCAGANTRYQATFVVNTGPECKILLIHKFLGGVFQTTTEYTPVTSPAMPFTNVNIVIIGTSGATIGIGLEAFRWYGGQRAATKTQLASVTVRNTAVAGCGA